MNIESIRIEFDFAEGAIRRLLGVIEARGFQVCSMSMGADISRANMTVGLAPRDPQRCVNVLSRQIARVQGVQQVARMNGASCVPVEVTHVGHG